MPCTRRQTSWTLAFVAALAVSARGAGPADGLLRLVPADAAATLAVEDLRDRTHDFLASPAAQGLRRLPAYQEWIGSGRFAKFAAARRTLESGLGEKLPTIRDELLGDAVVLALRVPAGDGPEQASGLLLVRVANRGLLERLIHGVNEAQRRSGELIKLTEKTRSGVTYCSREFRAESRKPAESYAILEDNTFAWSNAEELVLGVIDRSLGQGDALADLPRFQKVRQRLPARAAASLYVAPRFLGQVLASTARPAGRGHDRTAALVGRYLQAMEYFGAALEWRDGFVVRTEEILDPAKLDPWVRRWAARQGEITPALRKAPPQALAMASLHVDFTALLDVLRLIARDRQQAALENLLAALGGITLGHDFPGEVLPQLGPGMLAYVDAPGENDPPGPALPKVLIVSLGNAGVLAPALENALRTYLAIYALDARHGQGQLRLETRELSGRKVTSLVPSSPLAFATEGDRLVLGSSAAAVARAISVAANPTENELDRLRATRFPEAGSFACVDVVRLHDYLRSHRAALVARLTAGQRNAEEAEHDLEESIALSALFRQAYLTTAIEADATAVHRTLGLIPCEGEAASGR